MEHWTRTPRDPLGITTCEVGTLRKEQQESDAHIAELREVVERKGRPKTAKARFFGRPKYGRIVTVRARAS